MSKSNSWERATKMWLVKPGDKMCGICKKTSAGRCFLPSGTFGEWGKRRQRSWAFLCQRQSQSHCQGPPHHLFKILTILFAQTILPNGPSLLVELDYLCVYVCPSSLRRWCSWASQSPITIHILKAYDESYAKIIRKHKYKDKDTDKVPETPNIWNHDDSLIPNLMIDTPPWWPWL